jgi:hypothetical protein
MQHCGKLDSCCGTGRWAGTPATGPARPPKPTGALAKGLGEHFIREEVFDHFARARVSLVQRLERRAPFAVASYCARHRTVFGIASPELLVRSDPLCKRGNDAVRRLPGILSAGGRAASTAIGSTDTVRTRQKLENR